MTEKAPPKGIEIISRIETLHPPDIIKKSLDVELDPADIVLSGGAKSGTTWMQQILHGLRSRGDMDFEDMLDVFPFLEIMALRGSCDLKQDFSPRMYKVHGLYEESPKTDKIIVITRQGINSAAVKNWLFPSEELSMDEFVELFYVYEHPVPLVMINAYQLRHLESWYPHRKDSNVLWLHYEDLKTDLTKCIKMISDFTGIGVGDQELLDLAERQASLEFMKKHRSKFTLEEFRRHTNEIVGRAKDAYIDETNDGARVVTGLVNKGKEVLPKETIAKLDKLWIKMIKPVSGYDSYAEMRAAVNEELGRSFDA